MSADIKMFDEENRTRKFVGTSSTPWLNHVTGEYHLPEGFPLHQENLNKPIPLFADKWKDSLAGLEQNTAQAVVTPTGIISLRLRDQVQVDLTVDMAIRVINKKNNTILALNETGNAAALMHPNGRIYQYGSRVEILAHDLREGIHKYAKMWYRGISFTSEECAQIYLVDYGGTRTTTDTFTEMTKDFSIAVFYGTSKYGSQFISRAIEILEQAKYSTTADGSEYWLIDNVKISQAADGLLRITKSSNKYMIRTSPQNGTASLSSPFIHATASLGSTAHLFVRRGERRMHYDGSSFIVRNAGHSAGFDENNQLKVY